jgi:sulfate transport system ATP-binding protein
MSVAVTIETIEKRFENFPALRGVSLDIQPGELVALLGPSGSGKTTLLRLIAGLEEADRGRVLFGETDTRELSLRDRRIGFVFQQYALFKTMNVAENIGFGLKSRPRRERPSNEEIRKRVGDLLDLVQLPGLEKRYPSQLSGGQRQRVALARALAIEPRVLLLDEPFGALDAKVRKELRRWLRRLHDELHITSVFVTHDQEEALEVADRVVLMDHGRVEQVGSPTEVYERPATPFVYGFLGASNRFPRPASGELGFARPHEVAIDTQHRADGIEAAVSRVLSFGAASRVELTGAGDQHYEVELARERAEALALQPDQRVWLVPQRLSVFDAPLEEAA